MDNFEMPKCDICGNNITLLSHPTRTFDSEKGKSGLLLDNQNVFCNKCNHYICGECYKKLNTTQQRCPYCRYEWGDKKLAVSDMIGLGHHGPAQAVVPPPALIPTHPVPPGYNSFISVLGIVVPSQMPPSNNNWGFTVGGPPGSPSPLALADAWNTYWMSQGHPDHLD